MEVSHQLYILAVLFLGKKPLLHFEKGIRWAPELN
jgi:hypothetical protein